MFEFLLERKIAKAWGKASLRYYPQRVENQTKPIGKFKLIHLYKPLKAILFRWLGKNV